MGETHRYGASPAEDFGHDGFEVGEGGAVGECGEAGGPIVVSISCWALWKMAGWVSMARMKWEITVIVCGRGVSG